MESGGRRRGGLLAAGEVMLELIELRLDWWACSWLTLLEKADDVGDEFEDCEDSR